MTNDISYFDGSVAYGDGLDAVFMDDMGCGSIVLSQSNAAGMMERVVLTIEQLEDVLGTLAHRYRPSN